MTWFRFLVPKKPFFDLGKLVTFPNLPPFFLCHSPLKTFETWVNLPLSSKDLGNWGTDAKTMHSYLGWEQEFLGQKRGKSSHPRWFWFYQYVPLKRGITTFQLKQKSPFSRTTSTFLYFRPYDLTRGFVGAMNINSQDFCSLSPNFACVYPTPTFPLVLIEEISEHLNSCMSTRRFPQFNLGESPFFKVSSYCSWFRNPARKPPGMYKNIM